MAQFSLQLIIPRQPTSKGYWMQPTSPVYDPIPTNVSQVLSCNSVVYCCYFGEEIKTIFQCTSHLVWSRNWYKSNFSFLYRSGNMAYGLDLAWRTVSSGLQGLGIQVWCEQGQDTPLNSGIWSPTGDACQCQSSETEVCSPPQLPESALTARVRSRSDPWGSSQSRSSPGSQGSLMPLLYYRIYKPFSSQERIHDLVWLNTIWLYLPVLYTRIRFQPCWLCSPVSKMCHKFLHWVFGIKGEVESPAHLAVVWEGREIFSMVCRRGLAKFRNWFKAVICGGRLIYCKN